MATPFLAWFAIGDLSSPRRGRLFLYYGWGPYEVGPESGYVIGVPAAVVAAVAVGILVLRTRQGVANPRSWAVAAILAGAGVVGAYGWRLGTAGGGLGGNIGAGFALFICLPTVAALLVLAVRLAGGGGRWSRRRTRLLTLAAVLVAPALFAALYVLTGYDAAAGLITARQYADVRIGQTRSAVHERLGREGKGDFAMLDFPPIAPGLLCDYYDDRDSSVRRAYQFCFRAGVLVSKDQSTGQPFAN